MRLASQDRRAASRAASQKSLILAPLTIRWNVWKADDDIDKAVRGAFVSILTRSFTQVASVLSECPAAYCWLQRPVAG